MSGCSAFSSTIDLRLSVRPHCLEWVCILECTGNRILLDNLFGSSGNVLNLYFGLRLRLKGHPGPADNINSDSAVLADCTRDLIGRQLEVFICELSVTLHKIGTVV